MYSHMMYVFASISRHGPLLFPCPLCMLAALFERQR